MEDPFPSTQDGEEKRTSLAFVDSSTSGAFFDNFDDEIEPLMSSTMSSLDTPPFGGALMACLPRLDCAKPYFDIDTSDVRGRMWSLMSPASLKALLKFDWARRDRAAVTVLALSSPLLAAIAARGPDAWGPLWIALTAVFTIGAASNIVGWDIASNGVGVLSKTPVLAGWNIGVNGGPGGVATKPPVNFIKEEVYNGDVRKLTGALTLVAFFAMATPLLLAGLARLWKITHVRSAADAEFDVEGGAKESLPLWLLFRLPLRWVPLCAGSYPRCLLDLARNRVSTCHCQHFERALACGDRTYGEQRCPPRESAVLRCSASDEQRGALPHR